MDSNGLSPEELAGVTQSAQAQDTAQKAATLQGSLQVGQQHNPDEAVQAVHAGIDPDAYKGAVAAGYLPLEKPDPAAIAQQAPKTAAWLSNPTNAAVAHDDVVHLTAQEALVQQHAKADATSQAVIHSVDMWPALPQAGKDVMGAVEEGFGGLVKGAGELPSAAMSMAENAHLLTWTGSGVPAWDTPALRTTLTDPKNNPLVAQGEAMQQEGAVPGLLKDQATTITQAVKSGDYALAARKTTEAVAGFAPYIVAGMVPGGLLMAAGATGADKAEQARQMGLGVGAQTAALGGTAGTFLLAGEIPGMKLSKYLEERIATAAEPLVAKKLVGAALTSAIKGVADSMYHGALSGAALSGGNDLSDYISGVNPKALDGIGERMLETGAGFAAFSGATFLPGMFNEHAADVNKAMLDLKHVKAVDEQIEGSKLYARSPEIYNQSLDSQLEGSGLKMRHISPKDFDAVAEKHGVDPVHLASDLGIDKQYAAAQESGVDLHVKLADILTKLHDHPAKDAILENSKSDSDGITPAEAKIRVKEVRTQAVKETQDFQDSLGRVEEQRKQQILDTGKSEEQASKEAKLFSAFVGRQTPEFARNEGHEGATPEDFVSHFKLNEVKAGQEGLFNRIKTAVTGEPADGEPADENGLTPKEKAAYDKAMAAEEKRLQNENGGVAPLSKLVRDYGGVNLDKAKRTEKVEVPGLIKYGLARKDAAHSGLDTILEEIKSENHPQVQGMDLNDFRDALNKEHAKLDEIGEQKRTAKREKSKQTAISLYQMPENGPYSDKAGAIHIQHNTEGRPEAGFQATIERFKKANLSTGIHELGHYMLETMRGLAAMPNASEQVKEDLAKLEKFAGVEGGKWGKDNHEIIAKGLEKYVMEGKAPSEALQSTFGRLRGWMMSIYKSVRTTLLPSLSDEVRAVYDRMLATPDEIMDAQRKQGRNSWIHLTGNKEIDAKLEAVQEESDSKLLNKKMADIRRRETADWKASYESEKVKAKTELMAQPVRKAEMALSGKDFEGNELKDAEGNTIAPVKIGFGKNEVNPDEFASQMGFDNYEAMQRAMNRAKPFNTDVEATAKARADFAAAPSTEESRVAQAQDAIHNTAGYDLMKYQMRVLLDQHPQVAMQVLRGELNQEHAERLDRALGEEKAKGASKLDKAQQAAHDKLIDEKIKGLFDKLAANEEIEGLKMDARWFKAGQRKMGNLFVSNDEVRARASDEVSQIKVGDLNPNDYAVAERQARRRANELYVAGKVDKAMAEKGQELYAHECYRAAVDAKKEMQDGKDYAKSFDKESKRKKLAGATYGGFLEAIDQIRSMVSLKPPEEGMNKKQIKLVEWAKGMWNQGESEAHAALGFQYNPTLSAWIDDLATPVSWKDLPVQDFRDVVNTLKSLEEISRDMQKIKVGNETRDRVEMRDEMVGVMGERGAKFTGEEVKRNPATLDINGKWWENIGHKFASMLRLSKFDLINPETFANLLDLHKVDGVFRKLFFDPFHNGAIAKVDLQREIDTAAKAKGDELDARTGGKWRKSLGDLIENNDDNKDQGHDTLKVQYAEDEAPQAMKFTRRNLLAMAHYVGNEDNMSKLVDGYGEKEGLNGWTPQNVRAFLDKNMTREDWEAVQHHWDTFDPLWEKSKAMYERLGGKVPPKIIARPFDVTLADGSVMHMKGGYTPIDYDFNLAGPKSDGTVVETTAGKQYNYKATTTMDGSMVERTGHVGRVSLDLEASDARIRDTIHDLAYREPLQNAIKMLNDGKFRDAFLKTYGKEAYDSMVTAMKNIRDANSVEPKDQGAKKAFAYLRQGAVVTWVAGRISTLVKEFTGRQLKSVGYLDGAGIKHYASEVAEMGKNPRAYFAKSMEMFGEIRTRGQQLDRDLKVGHKSMYEKDSALDRMNSAGHSAFMWSDLSSSAPLAWAAYNHATLEGIPTSMGGSGKPMSHEDAVDYANSVVRQSHGTALETGRPNFINSKDSIKKQYSTLYGFMNTSLNQQMDMLDKAFGGKNHFANKGALVGRALALAVAPAVTAMLIHEGTPGKGLKAKAKWAAEAMAEFEADTVPFLRNLAGAIEYQKEGGLGVEDLVPPSLQGFIDLGNATIKSSKLFEPPPSRGGKRPIDYQDWLNAIGEFTHIPGLGQVGKAAQVAEDYRVGKRSGTRGEELEEATIGGSHKANKRLE